MSKTVEKEKADITRRVNHFNLRQKTLSFSNKAAACSLQLQSVAGGLKSG